MTTSEDQEQDVIRCEDLAYTYGRNASAVVAVHGVTCSVRAGMRLAITGPSGSGKSTLLHLMAGLTRPTTGSVSWPGLGLDPAGRPGLVGVVFQGPSLIPALNVVENVALPLILDGTTDREAHDLAQLALARLDIDDLSAKLPEELSGGQAQRIAIARVLALRPRIILADEPTGQLDRASGSHVVDVLFDAALDIGATLVVSTHDSTVSERFASRWQMHDGELTSDSSLTHDSMQRTSP